MFEQKIKVIVAKQASNFAKKEIFSIITYFVVRSTFTVYQLWFLRLTFYKSDCHKLSTPITCENYLQKFYSPTKKKCFYSYKNNF